jgi:hypothetical protein
VRRSGGQDLHGFSQLALASGYTATRGRNHHFPIDGRLGWSGETEKANVVNGSRFWDFIKRFT